MQKTPSLDDPDYAAFVWARYRRIMAWMTLLSLVAALGTLGVLWAMMGEIRLLMSLFVGGGIFLTVLLATALTSLMFLSAGTGHDDQVQDLLSEHIPLDP